MTDSEVMPNPAIWPVCDEVGCNVPYVLRRSLSFSKGWLWLWSQDCKHKKADARVENADGPVEMANGDSA